MIFFKVAESVLHKNDDLFFYTKKPVKYVPEDSDDLWRRRLKIALITLVMLEFFL